ncbi:uncharacterized protein At4g28440 isoform X3 [Elaeis guineensis]|uniref:Uncharacterized protein At4g28440 isoform X3 n=1 Tax=Elaeis guineensis var. tenera TaxID=51953 RepID=A0A6J0PRF8_ELAGV|nr:uncharacterized protein At4g28440 isoform X3 [Elaeis guineensis]
MAESKTGLRKPVFIEVDQLRPGTSGHTLTVKVVDSKMVLQKGRPDGPQVRQMRIAECLVGDETGMIVFTARNEQDNQINVLVLSISNGMLLLASKDSSNVRSGLDEARDNRHTSKCKD